MRPKYPQIFIFFVAVLTSLLASAGEGILTPRPASHLLFEENKNQLPSHVKFHVGIPGGDLFMEKQTLTFLQAEHYDFHGFHNPNPTNAPVTLKFHAYKVHFLNSDPQVQIKGTDAFPFVHNFYRGNDPSKWASDVAVYSGVRYSGIYPGIDIQFQNFEQHLKYDFIVQPGSNPSQIQLEYEGTDGLSLEYGHLYIKTSLGTTIEQKPYAYQVIDGSQKEVICSYVLNGDRLSFTLGNYDPNLPLVIDPTLIAATYTGSTADNWGYTATYDNQGNIYSAGIAASNGYPASVGAFQTTFQGGGSGGYPYPFDIAIIKYNPTGTTRMYATYYGGVDNEQPHSLIVNSAGQLFVAGRTYSSNFPTLGAYDNTYNGLADIIVGKFNATGGLLASTFIGGSGNDGVNVSANFTTFGNTKFNYADDGRSEIILDGGGNVYVAASTQSFDFPTVSAYDNALSGTQDGCVFKMNSTLSALTFSTYLGGSGYDAAYGLKLDGANNVYVCGGTMSSDFPTTAGVLKPVFGGTIDGFVAVLGSGGNTLLRSTFLGTPQYDQAYMIENDISNNIYIYGQTMGAYPVTGGVYVNANSAQFIHKMTGTLTTTIFSTVVGTGSLNPNISPTAFLVDSCESIYIAGWGRCAAFGHPNSNTVNGMPITANAIQPTTDGCDFYFMVLKPDAKGLTYATFYGENGGFEPDHVDGGTSRFDFRSFAYQSVCGSCGGTSGFPTTTPAWSKTNNSTNCNNAIVKIDMSVKPLAIANITGPTQGCAPFTVNTNNSGSQGSDYIWDWGDGSPITTLVSPSHVYTVAGNYTITLYAIDSLGICAYIDTATLAIHVGAPPVLNTTQTNILCFGANNGSASVSATGGMAPLTYYWSPSAQSSSAATGLSAVNYTVTVTDALGCSSNKTVTITQPPNLTLTTSVVPTSCGLSNGSGTATAGGGTPGYTYSWAGGQTTSSATGLAAGTYTMILTDANGCTRTSSVTVAASTSVSATTSATNAICGTNNGTATVNPSGGAPGYTYSWSNGQTTATATGLAVGNYSVTVTDAFGCSFTTTANVNVIGGPTALAGNDQTVCNGSSAQLNASGGGSYSWTPATGLNSATVNNPVATPSATTTFTIIVTDVNGCTDVDDVTIFVNPLPVAAFNAPPVCINTPPTSFTDQSTNATGWSWDFGDGSPLSNLQNPTHNYVAAGTYSVTLIATSAGGCSDTLVQVITVYPKPVAAYGATTVCFNNPTLFTDQSTGASQWDWNFGDGNTSTQQSPSHTYNAHGNYTVTLIVTNANGCKDTIATTVTVNPLPQAYFSAPVVCPNVPTCFVDSTTIASGSITGWSWNFGDPNSGPNNISNAQNPCHTYSANGTYMVFLTATSNFGCQSNINLNITVAPPPVAAFSVPNVCLNTPSQFTNNTTGGTQYFWQFGDGGTSNQQNPSHTYLGYGNYVVTLIAASAGGCTDTTYDTVSVNPLPIVNFTADSVCQGNPTTFSDLSFIPAGNITGWLWNFGDPASGANDTSTFQNPIHVYSAAGTYTVNLVVTSGAGCVSNLMMNVVVYGLPVADFSYSPDDGIPLTEPAVFTDLSTGNVVNWTWWFGDGDSSFIQNPTHIYSDTGTYVVTLAVENIYGCVDTIQYPLEIKEFTFYIPNTFTPNGDGLNDFFFGVGLGIVEYEMFIFDRWGNRIFYCKSNDLPQKIPCLWDGKVDGGLSNERVQEDVYVWKVNFKNVFKKRFSMVGHVNVVR